LKLRNQSLISEKTNHVLEQKMASKAVEKFRTE